MWLITVANIDDVAFVSLVYLIFLPIIVVWNSIIFGKSWWERPKGKITNDREIDS